VPQARTGEGPALLCFFAEKVRAAGATGAAEGSAGNLPLAMEAVVSVPSSAGLPPSPQASAAAAPGLVALSAGPACRPSGLGGSRGGEVKSH
jgi:hypothetical protein